MSSILKIPEQRNRRIYCAKPAPAEKPDIKINTNAAYFKWRESQNAKAGGQETEQQMQRMVPEERGDASKIRKFRMKNPSVRRFWQMNLRRAGTEYSPEKRKNGMQVRCERSDLWKGVGEILLNNILVCDDDTAIVDSIEIYLQQEGYHVIKAHDGVQALEALHKEEIQLVIIDVMMPRLDGIRAILKIREESNMPIIVLSAKTADSDKILGLNVGADDYVSKPFNPLELVARVNSQMRRYTKLGNAAESSKVFQSGGLAINDDLKSVSVDGKAVRLTPIEYNILLLLVKNQGRVFSINQIYENIWNEEAIGADNTVAVHIRHIREKIEINPKDPQYLKVVWGVGYKIEKIEPR